MRTIKFRAIGIDPSTEKRTGEWAYGYYEYDSYGSCHFISVTETNPELKQYNVLVDPSTVGQFTGLLDKDGKEIYEGDFIIAANGNKHVIVFGEWKYPSHIDTDEFVDHGIGFNIKGIEPFGSCVMGNGSLYEVIGNIHDNPELLK